MRKVIDGQFRLGSVDIGWIKLDVKLRDGRPALLIGLQAIWKDEAVWADLFHLLDTRRDTGRPGMHLWRVLVMGVLKQGLGCDCDRLQWIVNHDSAVQTFSWPRRVFRSRPVRAPDHPQQCGAVGTGASPAGERAGCGGRARGCGKKLGAALAGRCDSFVVETEVRHPTDVSLVRLAPAASLDGQGRGALCPGEHGAAVGPRPAEVQAFIDLSLELAAKADGSLKALGRGGCPGRDPDRIVELIGYARLFAGQIDRRVLQGETIPHHEKVFLIHEKHTRWIAKGKAGKTAELGVPVAVLGGCPSSQNMPKFTTTY